MPQGTPQTCQPLRLLGTSSEGDVLKLKPAEASRIADYLQRVVPAQKEAAELEALIKRLRGVA